MVVIGPMAGSVVINWDSVTNASGYNVFVSTSPNIDVENTAPESMNATPPYVVSELSNGTTYYFVVTATNSETEGPKSAEVSAVPALITLAGQPTAREILMLELVNRARFDPTAEAASYGIGLNDPAPDDSSNTPPSVTLTPTQKQPLAFNLQLMNSSRLHSQWMINQNIFSHYNSPDGSPDDAFSPWVRITNAGYSYSTAAENISWSGSTGSINLTSQISSQHRGLFLSVGHRVNILKSDLRELGIGQIAGPFTNGATYNASMITQNFGTPIGSPNFLTGVVYNDNNSNNIYDVGEGINAVTIFIDGASYTAFSAGAYSIPLINGTYDVIIAGVGLPEVIQTSVTFNGINKKLDVKVSGGVATVSSW